MVAEHFHGRGFKQFVFYSDTTNWSYDERGAGFVNALQQMGHACSWLRWHESSAFARAATNGNASAVGSPRNTNAWATSPLPPPTTSKPSTSSNPAKASASASPTKAAIVGAENYLMAADTMHTP